MQVEVGSVVDGKVTGITNFGAFVEMSGGQTGMVHISEVSNSYVKEIGDFLSTNQEVKVKILSVENDGKISLSMKRCEPEGGSESPQVNARGSVRAQGQESPRPPQNRRSNPRQNTGWQPKAAANSEDMSFEDMMTRFKQVSNDRISDLKKSKEPKRSRRNTTK